MNTLILFASLVILGIAAPAACQRLISDLDFEEDPLSLSRAESRIDFDSIKKEFEKIKVEIEKIKDESIEEIKKILEDIKKLRTTTIENGLKIINKLSAEFIEKLKQFKEKANKAIVDVTVCLSEKENEILNLPKNGIAGLNKCIQNEVDEAVNRIGVLLSEIGSRWEKVLQIGQELIQCKSWLCLMKITATIATQSATIPLEIRSFTLSASKFFLESSLSLGTCIVDQETKMIKQGGDLIADVIDCIDLKINKN